MAAVVRRRRAGVISLAIDRVASPFFSRNSSISGDVACQVLDSKNGRGRRITRPGHAASRPCRGLPLVARHYRTIAMHAPTCLTLCHAFPPMRTPLPDLGGTGFL